MRRTTDWRLSPKPRRIRSTASSLPADAPRWILKGTLLNEWVQSASTCWLTPAYAARLRQPKGTWYSRQITPARTQRFNAVLWARRRGRSFGLATGGASSPENQTTAHVLNHANHC